MNLPFYIARRIYKGQGRKNKFSGPAVNIAIACVAIGLTVMIISVCVVMGFKHTIRDKVVGFDGNIEVANFLTLQANMPAPVQVGDSLLGVLKRVPGVKHVQRFAVTQGILKTDNDFLGVAFKGVGQEWDSAYIAENMISGSIPVFGSGSSNNSLLVSKIMADKLHLKTGDKVFAYFIDDKNVRVRRFKVCGIYNTNLKKYDELTCFTDLHTVQKLNGWDSDQANGAEIKVKSYDAVPAAYDYIIDHVNRKVDKYGETYSSATIQELNPQLFAWLDLMDLNVWIILGLMLVVSGVTIVSGLLIIILEKVSFIGLLKAMGANNNVIRRIFVWLGAFIVGKGLVIGDVIAFLLLLLQKWTGIVKLDPATYYVSTVPVEMNVLDILIINVATLLICLLILIVPSLFVSRVQPSKSMRYE